MLAALADSSPARRQQLIQGICLTRGVPNRRRHPRRQVDRVFSVLTALVRGDPSEEVRREVAYALTFWFERRAPRVLLPVLLDASEAPSVRAQAAEGIGNVLSCHRLTPAERARVAAALGGGLADGAAEVRFWCLYAVGSLRLEELRSKVESLRDHDTSAVPHWWRVSEEASDVLASWDTGQWPERSRAEGA